MRAAIVNKKMGGKDDYNGRLKATTTSDFCLFGQRNVRKFEKLFSVATMHNNTIQYTPPRGWGKGTHRNADWVFVSQKAYCSNDGKTDKKSLLGDEIERTDEEIGIKLKVQTSLMPH